MSKSKKESGSQQWFLRTGVNAEFGPIEKSGLQLWAEQARVLPGHEVSNDRVNWVAATSVSFLDMSWFIDDGEGELKGPLNHHAAEALIKSGKFSKDARIVAADQLGDQEPEIKVEAPLESTLVKSAPLESTVVDKAVAVDSGGEEDSVVAPATLKSSEQDLAESARTCEDQRIKKLEVKIKLLEKQLRESKREQRLLEERYVSSDDHQLISEECSGLRCELEAARKLSIKFQNQNNNYEAKLKKFKDAFSGQELQLEECETKIQDAVRSRESALQQSRESERSFARLLSDANKRDIEYKEQIASLKKTSSLSPAEKDRFYSDQNAVFQILKRELDSITRNMEKEREYVEALKSMAAHRQQELEKQRQILQNNLGSSPAEMTSRVLREQTVDPNAVRIRSELDDLRVTHERHTLRTEERERDLNHKLKVMQSDCNKLMDQLLEKEREGISAQQKIEKLVVAEHELMELRRTYEAERKQFISQNNALVTRVDDLENGLNGSTPGAIQASEAKGVKLASWMSLKK